ncbi:MAG: mandelate racemase/muconate lactonizing enzyme family protein [Variovorax sp.]|nr:MAG: mandelate racemase/muconate lactonizing enzyme family protein [Variovorax sp.]
MKLLRPLPLAPLALRSIEAFVFRWPVKTPVRTSFGTMRDRPAVFVRATDVDGHVGWGEIWCNFPAVGAEHRARLLASVMAPLVEATEFSGPQQVFAHLCERTAVLALQSGEPGPMAQVIAGIDLALWDLCARRAGLPLWRFLGGESGRIGVYASGINPDRPEAMAAARRDEGYTAFKLKVGFGAERDIANLEAMRATLGPEAALMVDANQGWSLAQAVEMSARLERFDLGWLEEPLRADRPWHEWQALRTHTRLPLAGGENIAGLEAFDTALAAGVLSVMQPDAAKWGGISGCWPVIERTLAAGVRFCPHYLGAGIGLLASGHLLAAAGGGGWLEVDANENPLRSTLCGAIGQVADGQVDLGEAPGIGIAPEPAALRAAYPQHS